MLKVALYKQRLPFVLASSSPRRRELLSQCGLEFHVVPSSADESILNDESPEMLVTRLSELKARSVATEAPVQGVDWYVGADTVVAHQGCIMGKPYSEAEAFDMLRSLSGEAHEVWGGIALFNSQTGNLRVVSSMTKVKLAQLHQRTIEQYVSSGEPMDKAGAYGIQGLASSFVEATHGSYSNVVGLDVTLVISLFRENGIIE